MKFCTLAANNGNLIRFISFIRNIKNNQNTNIKTKCQNFAIKQIEI